MGANDVLVAGYVGVVLMSANEWEGSATGLEFSVRESSLGDVNEEGTVVYVSV